MTEFLSVAAVLTVFCVGIGCTAAAAYRTMQGDSVGIYLATFLGCVLLTGLATVAVAMAVAP